MRDFSNALIWLGLFASIFLGWYYYLKARNKERMSLIERDKDVSEIYAKQEIRFRFPWVKLGMLITGCGFGFTLGIYVSEFFRQYIGNFYDDGLLIFALVILFGGIGMVTGYFIDRPKSK